MTDALHFYHALLGFRIVDIRDPFPEGREVPDEPLLHGMPRWMRHSLYLYTVAAVVFTGMMVYWVSRRVLGELIPRTPELIAQVDRGLTAGPVDVPAVLDALLRLGFSLLFLYFVLSLGFRLVVTSVRWLTGQAKGAQGVDGAKNLKSETEDDPADASESDPNKVAA